MKNEKFYLDDCTRRQVIFESFSFDIIISSPARQHVVPECEPNFVFGRVKETGRASAFFSRFWLDPKKEKCTTWVPRGTS